MENKILAERRAILEAITTLRYQIDNLKPYYSREQVRCWNINLKRLRKKLKRYPTPEQVEQHARETTAIIKAAR